MAEKNITIPTAADAELALRRAAEKGLVEYVPGDSDFEISGEMDEQHKKALEFIKEVMKKIGSTGVQKTLNSAVFELLGLIPVYPVEDENKLTDKKGNVLPDTYLVPNGTTVRQLAYKIHTDIGEKFICGIDCRTKKKLGAEHELKNNDVVSIQASK